MPEYQVNVSLDLKQQQLPFLPKALYSIQRSATTSDRLFTQVVELTAGATLEIPLTGTQRVHHILVRSAVPVQVGLGSSIGSPNLTPDTTNFFIRSFEGSQTVQKLFIKCASHAFADVLYAGTSTPDPLIPVVTKIGAGVDSFTYGVGASTTNNSYLSLISAALGVSDIVNAGVPGALLQNTNHHASNEYDRYQTDFGSKSISDIILLVGYNDSFYGSTLCQTLYPSYYDAQLTVAIFKTQLDTIVKWLIANVVLTPDRIRIGSMPRNKSTLFQGTDGATFFDSQKQYHLEIARVAYANGCKFAPVFDYMMSNGGDKLVSSDEIHSNDLGHAAIASCFLAATVPSAAPVALYPTPSGSVANLALNKPCTSLSTLDPTAYGPGKAVDGNRATDNTSSYVSGGTTASEYWQVDLQAAHQLSYVRVYIFPGIESTFTNLLITASNNADASAPLSVVSTPKTIASNTVYVDVLFGNYPNARYVRITSTTSGSYQDFPEIEVYGY